MFRIYPERLEGLVRITNLAPTDTLLVYSDVQCAWWAAGEERKREDANEYQDSQNDVTEDHRSNSQRDRDNTYRPEPVWTSFLMFILMGVPLYFKRWLWHGH